MVRSQAVRYQSWASCPQEDPWAESFAARQRRECELADLVQQLTDQMMAAARDLKFELAGRLRDEIQELKREIRDMDAAGVTRPKLQVVK